MLRLIALLALALLASACSAPKFEFQSQDSEAIAACRDDRLSPGEADVDCGHVCAVPCAASKTCIEDGDCASSFCSAGVCTDQTCVDGLKNQDESDIDCGGDMGCAPCTPGKTCTAQSDCNGGPCDAGKCRAASCDDAIKDQAESDVDCGGSCEPCATGQACQSNDDCDLALCTGGKCRAQTCADGLVNQDETDVDCGGLTGCPRCASTEHCSGDNDCDGARCSKGACQPMSCSDGVKNGTETGVDCGGSCDPCADGGMCLVAADCVSKVCTLAIHQCAVPSCNDGVLNGDEPTQDCGASCSTKCQLADTCKLNNDCGSGKCFNLHCVPKSPTNTPLPSTSWNATASHTYSTETPARLGIDGDPNTRWTNGAPQTPGMWFLVDMGKPQVFFSITMTSDSQPSDYAKTLRLLGSSDGQTFTELRTGISGEQDLKVTFSDAQYARYLKVELLAATNGLWWRIDDLRVLQ